MPCIITLLEKHFNTFFVYIYSNFFGILWFLLQLAGLVIIYKSEDAIMSFPIPGLEIEDDASASGVISGFSLAASYRSWHHFHFQVDISEL